MRTQLLFLLLAVRQFFVVSVLALLHYYRVSFIQREINVQGLDRSR